MNTNPDAKRILCFGDSNTHGTIPYQSNDVQKERYASNERWTWVLQEWLGMWYEVIEEGRWGRTIALPWWPDGNDVTKIGYLFLEGLLNTHVPLDLVIVMLGTNDIKESFRLQPPEIAKMMQTKIVDQVKAYNIPLLLVSPPSISDGLQENFPWGSHDKIVFLNTLYKELADTNNFFYLDVQSDLLCGADGIHLTKESHLLLWQKITDKVKSIF